MKLLNIIKETFKQLIEIEKRIKYIKSLNLDNFNNRQDVEKFISEYESDLKHYRMNKRNLIK